MRLDQGFSRPGKVDPGPSNPVSVQTAWPLSSFTPKRFLAGTAPAPEWFPIQPITQGGSHHDGNLVDHGASLIPGWSRSGSAPLADSRFATAGSTSPPRPSPRPGPAPQRPGMDRASGTSSLSPPTFLGSPTPLARKWKNGNSQPRPRRQGRRPREGTAGRPFSPPRRRGLQSCTYISWRQREGVNHDRLPLRSGRRSHLPDRVRARAGPLALADTTSGRAAGRWA
jgi:hypothetical protein